MIFVMYALYFFALLSISTAVPIVNDDENQGVFNGPSHSVVKRGNPEGPPVGHQSPLQSGLQFGLLYILREKNGVPVKIPVICFDQAVDKDGRHIPGRFRVVELVEDKKVKFNQLHLQYRLTGMRPAERYFSGPFNVFDKKSLGAFSVKLSPQDVNEENVDKTVVGMVTHLGWMLLQIDIKNLWYFIHNARPDLRPGALYIRVQTTGHGRDEKYTMVPVIYLAHAVDDHFHPIPGEVSAVELILDHGTTSQAQPGHLRGAEHAMRYFHTSFPVLGTMLNKYCVKISDVENVDETSFHIIPLDDVTHEGWELLKADITNFRHHSSHGE